MPEAAVARLVDQVRSARSARRPVDIRAGGTKAFYGGTASGDPLDVREIAGISGYEPTELVVTVRAGTLLSDLERALGERGQHLPFEPPRFAPGGTVGGMVAAGLSGPARAAAGGIRDYVLGATMISGRGELLGFGGQVMKNVAGYDISRVLAGSMGTLGVICEVSLKVLPVPVSVRTLRFEIDEAGAIRHMNEWGGQPLPLNASAWWNGTLVVRLAGAAAAVDAAQARLGGEPIEPLLASTFWSGLRDHSDEFFTGAARAIAAGARLWRLSVPSTSAPIGLSGEQLIEWGGAQRWWCTSTPTAAVRAAASAAGGHATIFCGSDKSGGVFAPLSPAQHRLHIALKQAFDPDRILNPGRLYPDL